MATITIEQEGCRCERCGHEWVPRNGQRPLTCPQCRSAYWDRPRKVKP